MVNKWQKKLKSIRFKNPVPCPYNCGENFNTSLSLCRHVLSKHNWNKDYKEWES